MAPLQQARGAAALHLLIAPTGGYEGPLVSEAYRRPWRVTVVNPLTVRPWQQSRGTADRLDTQRLTRFGAEQKPPTPPPTDEAAAQLASWLRRQDDRQRRRRRETAIPRFVPQVKPKNSHSLPVPAKRSFALGPSLFRILPLILLILSTPNSLFRLSRFDMHERTYAPNF
jgi:hypothetical protein